jgi:RNA polymerase subunit RPABC4/transcription elongation factor Spt4
MRRYCHPCGTKLHLNEIKCPYCRRSSISWLHIIGITAVAGSAIFYLLKVF